MVNSLAVTSEPTERSIEAHSPIDFGTWYARAWPRLAAALTAVVGSPADAEDLASQATAMAYERWDKIDDPSGWTYRVAINLARGRWRKRRREAQLLTRWIERPASLPDVSPEVWVAIGKLPQRERIAIALRYVADLQQDEIAVAMGIAPGTVAATLHSARAHIKDRLDLDERKVDHDGLA